MIMSLAGAYRLRRAASIAALGGILFYTALLPLHTVSQATQALLGSELATALRFLCHGAPEIAADRAAPAPGDPALPQKRCPFCQGLAAFQFAIVAAIALGLLRFSAVAGAHWCGDEGAPGLRVRPAHNRGPPRFRG